MPHESSAARRLAPATVLLTLLGSVAGAGSQAAAPVALLWGDVDGDGSADLFRLGPRGDASLLVNLGGGELRDVTAESGIVTPRGVHAASWRDFDGDGRLDLLQHGAAGATRLWRNAGGLRFEDATERLGPAGALAVRSAQWRDYDGDGWLDLELITPEGPCLLHGRGGRSFRAVPLGAPTAPPSAPGSVLGETLLAGGGLPSGLLVLSRSPTPPAGFTAVGESVTSRGPDAWTPRGSLGSARYFCAAAAAQGRVYALGGYDGSNLASVEAYDPATDTWTPRAGLPTARRGVAAASTAGKVFAFGGLDTTYLDETLAYDPATNTWAARAALPVPVQLAGAAELGGFLYVVGGSTSSGATGALDRYDHAQDTWTTLVSTSTPRQGPAVTAAGGRLYVLGGFGGGSHLATAAAYDPATGAWSAIPPMSTPRTYAAAEAVDGRVYVFGGWNGAVALQSGETYDPITQTWSPVTAMPGGVRYGCDAAVVGRRIYTVGGYDLGSYLTTTEEYVPGVRELFVLQKD